MASLVASACTLVLACSGDPGSHPMLANADHVPAGHDGGSRVDVEAVHDARADVGTTAERPSPTMSCGAPIHLSPTGTTGRTASTRDGGDPVVQACLPSPSAQVFFEFDAPAGQRVVFTAVPLSGTFRLAARMVITCEDDACIDSDASPIPGAPAVVGYSNDTTELRHKLVAVSSAIPGMEGGFVAALRYDPLPEGPPPGDGSACGSARTLEPGAVIHDQFVASSLAGADACPSSEAAQRYYRVTVAGRSRVLVTARSVLDSGLIWRPQIRVLDGCHAPRCVSMDRSPTGSVSATPVLLENLADDARDFVVTVASPSAADTGARVFAIDAAAQALPAPASNASCDGATLLTIGPERLELDGDTANATDTGHPCEGAPSSWKVLYYAVDVPAGAALRVTLRGSYDHVRLRQDCASTSCLAEASTTEDSGPRYVDYTNPTSAPRRVILEVGSHRAPVGGFSLVLAITPAT